LIVRYEPSRKFKYKRFKAKFYLLVDDNTDGSLVHVEHNTGSTVVVLEGHTLVDGGIHLDIHIVTSLFK
jgi:hypothetical protein